MQAGVRRGRPGHDLESVLRGAVKVFNERGYDGTSMEDLARELGITKSAIYHHVMGKEELLRLAVDRALDELFAVLAEVSALDAPAMTRLEELARRSVLLLVAELPFVTLLLRVRGNTKVERQALARRRSFDLAVASLATQARDEGDLRPDVDPALVARLLYGMINSVTEWYRPLGSGRSSSSDLAEVIVAVAFDGLRLKPLRGYRGLQCWLEPLLHVVLGRVARIVQAERTREMVAEALRSLSPLHRRALNETILRDRTVNQAAEVLGIPVGTVKSRVYYALRALQVVLAERGVLP